MSRPVRAVVQANMTDAVKLSNGTRTVRIDRVGRVCVLSVYKHYTQPEDEGGHRLLISLELPAEGCARLARVLESVKGRTRTRRPQRRTAGSCHRPS